MVSTAPIDSFASSTVKGLKDTGFKSVINHSFYFWENNSVKRTPIGKDIIEKAINSVKMRQPRLDELSIEGQINLVRQELRAMYPNSNVY